MTNNPLGLEGQLRQYADGIVPDGYVGGQAAPNRRRRGPSIQTTWLIAAAAVLVIAALAIGTRPDSTQNVNTAEFVQQPNDEGAGDATTPAQVADATPPLPDGVPPTGDWRTREEGLVVMLAQFVLVDECMAAQGFEFALPTDQEWVELFGSWRTNGVLGIGTEGGARLLGYHDANWGGAGSPSQSAAFQAMTPEEEAAWVAALTGLDPAPDTFAPAIGVPEGGCWAVVEAALGDYQNREIVFDQALQPGADGTQGERFRSDPALAAAITAWQDCIRDSVGIEADTPNTLARQFAFSGAANDREREIAVADARCQDEVDLEETFYLARSRQRRSELGNDVTIFDDYARFRIEILELSQQVLDERGIVPPSLD